MPIHLKGTKERFIIVSLFHKRSKIERSGPIVWYWLEQAVDGPGSLELSLAGILMGEQRSFRETDRSSFNLLAFCPLSTEWDLDLCGSSSLFIFN